MGNRLHTWVFALIVAGCNDSMRVNNPISEESTAGLRSEPAASARATETTSATAPLEESAPTADPSGFDPDMAKIVLERARRQAVQCPAVAKDTPVGEGEIEVVIDGRTGKIIEVMLGTTFTAGSPTGQACLKNAFIGQIVTPFQGRKTVPFTLNIPAAPAPEKDPKTGKKKP